MSDTPTDPRASTRAALRSWPEPAPAAALVRSRHYRWLVVGTVCVGAFMGQVDASIAQLALPHLEHAFHARLSLVSWVALGYLLSQAALLPVFGRLADIRGRKFLYTAGFLVFIVGSAACAMAPGIGWLIAFRVVQAVGAAMLSANSVAIIVSTARPEERGRALGVQATAQALGLSFGPLIGGVLLQTLDWRWVFWINVPVGVIGTIAAWTVLPVTRDTDARQRLDVPGMLLLVPALFALLLAINHAQDWGGFLAPTSLAFAAVAFACLGVFLAVERRRADPLVDPALLRNRKFLAGSLAGTASYGMLFGLFLVMPFVFARVSSSPPILAGLKLAAIPVALAVVAPLSGALSERLDARLLTVPGMTLCLAGLAWLRGDLGSGMPGEFGLVAAIALVGAGQGLFISPNNRAIISAAPEAIRGEAGSMMNVFRAVGMSLGIAAATSVMATRLATLAGPQATTVSASPGVVASAAAAVALALIGFAGAALVLSQLPGRQLPPGS
jgi:EmrB/QacA subfamily drug resistance transporter